MEIIISAIGKIGSFPIKILIDEYKKRLPWKIQINELQLKTKAPIEIIKEEESKLLLSSCEKSFIILLDENGSRKNSIEFASMIRNYQEQGNTNLAFLIGGAYGHGNLAKEKANMKLSLSTMTLPHIMVRLVLVEQIYRAYTINNNHPYHKI